MGRPDLSVLPTTEAMAVAAAAEAAAVLRQAVEARGSANAMFATGNSQLAFVAALTEDRAVPWEHVVAFHMDEYVGVGPDHPAGFRHWIHDRIEVPARPLTVHYLDGLAPPADECERYARLLDEHPLDLCCLGIGENGHLAFNDPPVADFDDPVDLKVVELDDACRRQQVNEGHFPSEDQVPALAVTVTIPALLRAGRVLAIVPEARKAIPVRDAIEGPVTTSCPASVLQQTGHASIYLDAAAASLLGN